MLITWIKKILFHRKNPIRNFFMKYHIHSYERLDSIKDCMDNCYFFSAQMLHGVSVIEDHGERLCHSVWNADTSGLKAWSNRADCAHLAWPNPDCILANQWKSTLVTPLLSASRGREPEAHELSSFPLGGRIKVVGCRSCEYDVPRDSCQGLFASLG